MFLKGWPALPPLMKRGHSVRFCKIRKYYVPKGIMRWIPKSSKDPIDKAESK